MAFTATFNNPAYNYSGGGSGATENVVPINMNIELDFDVVSELTFEIHEDAVSLRDVETDDTNSVQLDSTCVVKRDGNNWFYGYVFEKPLLINTPSGNVIYVKIRGEEGVLLDSICVDSTGNDVWGLETSSVKVTDMPLRKSSEFGSFVGDTLWPDPTDATGADCYTESADTDLLDSNIGNGTYAINYINQITGVFGVPDNVPAEFDADETLDVDGSTGNDGTYTIASAVWTGARTEITVVDAIPSGVADGNVLNKTIALSTTFKAWAPRGWIWLDDSSPVPPANDEYIYFDGYDNSGADGKYRLRNVARGQLGTSPLAHVTANVVVKNLVAKQIATGTVVLEKDPTTGTYVKLRRDREYVVNAKLGCFILSGVAGVGNYRATYSVYDEDGDLGGTVVISLSDVVKAIVKGPYVYGGPGFVDGDLNFDSSVDAILVNRYDYDPEEKPVYAWDAILDLIAGLSLEKQIKIWFDHANRKLKMKVLSTGAKVFSVPWVRDIAKEVSIKDNYSAIRVAHADDQNLNRITKGYSWHDETYTVDPTSPELPDEYWYCDSGGEDNDQFPGKVVVTTAGNLGMHVIGDGKPGSKLGGVWIASGGHDPVAYFNFDFGHWWFGEGTTPPLITLDKIVIRFNAYRGISGPANHKNDDGTYVLRLDYCTDYSTVTHTGTWQELGFTIEGVPTSGGTWVEAESSLFVTRKVNAIRVVWEYMPGIRGCYYAGIIHDLIVEGNTINYTLVQLTDDYDLVGNPRFLYAPASFEKLRGGVGSSGSAGAQRVLHYPIGAVSEGAAISLARTLLKVKLRQYQLRHYSYKGLLPAKPGLGVTLGVDEDDDGVDDYVGIVQSVKINVSGTSGIYTEVSMMDYDADLIE